jgi:hypothetical protein
MLLAVQHKVVGQWLQVHCGSVVGWHRMILAPEDSTKSTAKPIKADGAYSAC